MPEDLKTWLARTIKWENFVRRSRCRVYFSSISAFAPISNPTQCPWGVKAFKEEDKSKLICRTLYLLGFFRKRVRAPWPPWRNWLLCWGKWEFRKEGSSFEVPLLFHFSSVAFR